MDQREEYSFKTPLIGWLDERLPILSFFRREYVDHLLPRHFNKGWNLIVSVMLMLVIVTGLLLSVHYIPHEDHAFASVQKIMRDVDYGWMIRYLHLNGASFLFIATYIHIFRSMYYGAFKKPKELVWIFGVIILFLLVVSAFTGYVLTMSQMGGWAATVITNMFTAVPLIGEGLKGLILGGSSIGTATLTRFYMVHFIAPFLILLLVFAHIWSLRTGLAKKPLKLEHYEDPEIVPFHPYHTYKGLVWLSGFLCVFVVFTFFFPEALSPYEHFIPYDPMIMPEHIMPEWYLLPFYGMLKAFTFGINIYLLLGLVFIVAGMWPIYRSKDYNFKVLLALLAAGGLFCMIGYAGQLRAEDGSHLIYLPLAEIFVISAKSIGIIAMTGIFISLFLLPWLDTHEVRNGGDRPIFKWTIRGLVLAVLALGFTGAMPPSGAFVVIGQLGVIYFFGWFYVVLPVLSKAEPILK